MPPLAIQDEAVFDVAVIGSGFAGSLLAHALDAFGLRVLVVERGRHPRFAVGESSTPLADLSLRRIAARAGLTWLEPLSRFGSWQAHRPELLCGRKRGFSYVFHPPGAASSSAPAPDRMFHVAASSSDQDSDTQWYRPDVDRFLTERFAGTAIRYTDRTRVVSLLRDRTLWRLAATRDGATSEFRARFLIDATGSSAFSQEFFRVKHPDAGFKTCSRAVYTHFEGLPRWRDRLEQGWNARANSLGDGLSAPSGVPSNPFPYDPDFAALHHVLQEGWVWMLRFENDRVSTGLVVDGSSRTGDPQLFDELAELDGDLAARKILQRYPALWRDLARTPRAARPDSPALLDWHVSPRLQRTASSMQGPGWLMAPHTAGFVDPLHSTGLAHTLHGIERILDLFDPQSADPSAATPADPSVADPARPASAGRRAFDPLSPRFRTAQTGLESDLRLEFSHIDRLVAVCYATRHDPEAFRTAATLYFVNTIHAEQALLTAPTGPVPSPLPPFLSAGNAPLHDLTRELADRILAAPRSDASAVGRSRFDRKELQTWAQAIRAHDPVGLFEPDPSGPDGVWRPKKIITHSAVSLG